MTVVCLDVNVWVSNYRSTLLSPGKTSAARALVNAVFAGVCSTGPLQLIVSHTMLDTLEAVLMRDPATAPIASVARDQVELIAGQGFMALAPAMVLGGTASFPFLDHEDAGVLMTAITGGADLLVTGNMRDFVRGPRARIDSVTLQGPAKVPEVIVVSHPRQRTPLYVASPGKAAGWIVHGDAMPTIGEPVMAAQPDPQKDGDVKPGR